MAKVLLINPPMLTEKGEHIDGYTGVRPRLPTLGLAYIASVLEKHGHSVRIIDGVAEIISMEEIGEISKSFDISGITSTTSLALLSHGTAAAIKKENQKIPVVMGGPHASIVPQDVLEDQNVDYVAIGEGEYTFLELTEALGAGEDIGNVRGIAYKRGGELICNEQRPIEEDLDKIPMPARHLLPMHLYRSSEVRSRRHPALHAMSSRGCPYNCSFCGNKILHRCKLRMHSAERVVEEMGVLVKDYNAKEIHFWDDCFVSDEKRVYEICSLLHKNKLNIAWDCEATITKVNLNLLKEIKRAGCIGVNYGIETGNDERMKKINKGWLNRDKIRQALKWTRQSGLRSRGYFIMGFVGETLSEMEDTIKFSKEIDLDFANFSLLVPLPGTLDYERAKKEGSFDPCYWKHKLVSEMGFPMEDSYLPPGITKDELLSIQRRACREFYFRPKIILRRLIDLRSAENLLGSLKFAFSLLRKRWG